MTAARPAERERVSRAPGPYLDSLSVVPVERGFSLFYHKSATWSEHRSLYRLEVDTAGTPRSAPTEFSRDVDAPSILKRGEEFLMSWSETGTLNTIHPTVQEPTRYSAVRLARFDARGQRLGPIMALQAPTPNQENMQPHLSQFGDDIALVWSQGSVIYVCGGCVRDNRLRFVVLDGQDFTPKSSALDLVNPLSSGGLMAPIARNKDSDFLILGEIAYHTDSKPMAASVRCNP